MGDPRLGRLRRTLRALEDEQRRLNDLIESFRLVIADYERHESRAADQPARAPASFAATTTTTTPRL